MKKHRKLILLVLLAATSIAALSVYRQKSSYDIAYPKTGEITEAVYGLGTVKSNRRYEVIIGVLSTVQKLYVQEGASVSKDQPLIRFEEGSLFRAPFAGTITYVKVREGETALPHAPTIKLEDLSDRYIELSFEQQAALRIKKGQPAKVSFESLRGKVLSGQISALFSRESEFIGLVSVNGLDSSVLPGMTADVTVEIGRIPDATLIPLKAIQNGMVTVRKKGERWRKVKVEIGHIDGLYAEVLHQALSPEDEVRVPRAPQGK